MSIVSSIRTGAGAAVVALLAAHPALALEADAFAQRLTEVLKNQNFELSYESASLEGSNVVLNGAKVAPVGVENPAEVGALTFENVTDDGGTYTVERFGASNVEGNFPAEGDGPAFGYSIGSWGVENMVLPPEGGGAELATAMGGFSYDRLFIEDAAFTADGKPFMTLASADSTIDPNSSPLNMTGSMADLVIDLTVPPDPSGELTKWVEGTGYEKIEVDGDFAGTWDLTTGLIDVPNYAFDFANMGKLGMEMAIGGYTPAFAKSLQEVSRQTGSSDPQAQQAAGMQMLGLVSQLSFGRFILSFEDAGMTDRLLEYYAQTNGQTKDQLVQQTIGILPLVLGQLQAPELQAQIQEAVTSFLNDPKSITVSLNPDTTVAFPVLMGAAMSSPSELAKALNAQVTANR